MRHDTGITGRFKGRAATVVLPGLFFLWVLGLQGFTPLAIDRRRFRG